MKTKTKKIRIHVTKEDILNGVRANYNKCPVALAIKRRIKPDLYVEVRASGIDIGDVHIVNSINTYGFISRFDNCPREYRDSITPIRFMIEIPSGFVKRK